MFKRNVILFTILVILLNLSIFYLIISPPQDSQSWFANLLSREKYTIIPPSTKNISSFVFQKERYTKNPEAHGIFNPMFSKKFVSAESKRYLVLYHFRFCKCLDDSLFDGMSHVYGINGSISTENPYIDAVSKLIDEAAKKLINRLYSEFPDLNEWEALRYACYTAAVGTSPALSVSKTPFIRDFRIRYYFKDILPTFNRKSIKSKQMPKYQLAYLIYVPDENALANMKALVTTLNNGNAVFMIQLDAKCGSLIGSPDFLGWAKRKHNIFISTARYNDRWVKND